MFSSANQAWDTPLDYFMELNDEFDFEWDLAANAENSKCEKYYTEEQDSLKQEWKGVCWLNPPYGEDVPKFVKKAHESTRVPGTTVVMLIASRTDTKIFHKYIWDKDKNTWRDGVKGRFLPGRLVFGSDAYWQWVYTQEFINGKKNSLFGNTKGKRNAAPFPSLLVIFETKNTQL